MQRSKEELKDEFFAKVESLKGIDPVSYAARAIDKFDYTLYSRANQLSVADWYEQLRHRSMRLQEAGDSHDEFTTFYLEVLSTMPVQTLMPPEHLYSPSVMDMSVLEAWDARSILESIPDEADACRMWELDANTVRNPDGPGIEDAELVKRILCDSAAAQLAYARIFESYNDVLAGANADAGGAFVFVGLAAPDEVIIKDFKEWLSTSRSKFAQIPQSPVARFSESDLRRWAQHRVLAYLDLLIFAKISGVELTNFRIGSLIFPDIADVDVTEKVRKSTAPLALELISDQMIDALGHAATACYRSSRKESPH